MSFNNAASMLKLTKGMSINPGGFKTCKPPSKDAQYIRASLQRFIKSENRYEFSKFGCLTFECKDNFFDSFSIIPTDLFIQLCVANVNNMLVAIQGAILSEEVCPSFINSFSTRTQTTLSSLRF